MSGSHVVRGGYRDDRTTACSRGMRSRLEDVLPCKRPVAEAKISHLIQSVNVQS